MTWTRPSFAASSSRRMRLQYVAVLDGARIDDDPGHDGLTVHVRAAGAVLAELLAGRPAALLEDRAPHDRVAVERARWVALVEADLPDAADLGALAAATAFLARLAADDDLVLACDLTNARWWAAAELAALAAGRPFDVDEHVTVGIESVERRPGAGHVVRSRGLAKLARPDVCARVARPDTRLVAELLRDVASALADGLDLTPGDRIASPLAPPFTVIPRTDDALADAPAASAPLFELRDLLPSGPGPDLTGVVSALRPKRRLKVL